DATLASEGYLEPVTHILTGVCLGRAGLNRKTGLATLTLALAAEAPDIDSLSYIKGSVSGLQHHRGITHSFLGAPFVAALTLAIVYGVYRWMKSRGRSPKLPPDWKLLYLYALLGTLMHLFQDFTNNYGVRPFAPFNPKWYSWDIVFIVDPIMLVALFLGLVVPGLMALVTEEIGSRKPQFKGRGGAIFALVCLALVILARDFEHRRAVNALNARSYHGEDPLRASAFPRPVNLFAWSGVVETRDFFELMPVDSQAGEVDPLNQAVTRYKPEETPASLAAKKSRLGQVYLDWAAYPVVTVEKLEGGRYQAQFEDLRFESVEGLALRRRPPLAGYVVLDPQLRVEEMFMGRPPQSGSAK
ncbi:MAG TPA: metal-dependent hydrolase, partial [Candidatus Angelobacter sp.]|nr:metal-dependent hydrolase [Candidatus Angelobacter sp.]